MSGCCPSQQHWSLGSLAIILYTSDTIPVIMHECPMSSGVLLIDYSRLWYAVRAFMLGEKHDSRLRGNCSVLFQ